MSDRRWKRSSWSPMRERHQGRNRDWMVNPEPPSSNPEPPSSNPKPPRSKSEAPLFPSASYNRSTSKHEELPEESGSVVEQLFPPGKVSDLARKIDVYDFIGLEYMIEIQHNTVKKMANNYNCLLCNSEIKVKKDPVDTIELAKNHLRSTQHKLKYLAKFFPTIKDNLLGMKNDSATVASIVDRLLSAQKALPPMKVKIVVGQKLFKRKCSEIKSVIDNSTHFVENVALIEEFCGKVPQKTRMDQYDSVFEELEKESEKWDKPEKRRQKSRQRSPASPRQRRESGSSFKTETRRIDEEPLEGVNPVNEPPPPVLAPGLKKSGNKSETNESKQSSSRRSGEKRPHHSRHDRGGRKSRSPPSSCDEKTSKKRSKKRSCSRSSLTSLSSLSSIEEVDDEGRGRKSRSKSSRKSPAAAAAATEVTSGSLELEKANKELDSLVQEYLTEESKMLSWMDSEKRKYLARPESHPDYTAEWNYFYEKTCKRERTKVHPSMVRDEWDHHWERFIKRDFDLKVDNESIRLQRHYGLTITDIREFRIRQKNKSQSPDLAGGSSESPAVTVLNTLRILSAIEDLLGSSEAGYKTNIFLAQAKNLESKSQNSQDLLKRQDFIDFLADNKQVLLDKLNPANNFLAEAQQKGVRTAVDNLTLLLQMSSLKPTEKPILNLEKYQDPLKVRIAETIISHYKDIDQQSLDKLVMSEFNRIQDLQASNYQQQQQPPQTSSSSAAGINWDAIQNAVQQVTQIPGIEPSGPEQPAAGPVHDLQPGPSSVPENDDDEKKEQPTIDDEYDDLSIEELTSLFQNFKELDKGTQSHLISYMQRLEKSNPQKVTEFKKHLHSVKNK